MSLYPPHPRGTSPSPVQDLTEEFKRSTPSQHPSAAPAAADGISSTGSLDAFFNQHQRCLRGLAEVREGRGELDRLHRHRLCSPLSDEEDHTVGKQIEALDDSVTSKLLGCKALLDDIAAEESQSPRESLIRKQNLHLLRSKFVRESAEFERMQRTQRDRYRQQLRRQYLIVNPQASQEQLADLDRMTAYGQLAVGTDVGLLLRSSALFSQSLTMSLANQQLSSMQDRLESMRQLERSVQEVSRMVATVATLVQQQGAELQRLYDHVASVEEVSEKTVRITKEAVKKAEKRRRFYFILAGVVVFLVLFVIVIVYVGK